MFIRIHFDMKPASQIVPCNAVEKSRVETLLKYLEVDKKQCDDSIAELTNNIKEYNELKNRISEMAKSLSTEVKVPVGKFAYIPGVATRTNEYLCVIGDNHFVTKSAYRTIEFINRRIQKVNDKLKAENAQKELIEQRVKMASDLFSVTESGTVEIIEPYDENVERRIPKRRVKAKQPTMSDFSEVMDRLKILEDQEKELDELENVTEPESLGRDATVDADELGKSYRDPPKGIPKEDFERLLKHLDEMDEKSDDEWEDNDDDEETDSDDHEPSEANPPTPVKSRLSVVEKPAKSEAQRDPPETSEVNAQSKKGVRFSTNHLGPTGSESNMGHHPDPAGILKNKDEKPRVDRQYAEWMNHRFDKKIVPGSKSVLNENIVEKDPLLNLGCSKNTQGNANAPRLSKFKKSRK